MSDPNGVPAGWYQATDQPGQQRFHDGTKWTDHYAPIAATPGKSQDWPKAVLIPVFACLALLIVAAIVGAVAGGDKDDVATERSTTTAPAPTTQAGATTTERAESTERPTTTRRETTTTTAPPTTSIPPAQLQAEIDAEAQRVCTEAGISGIAARVNFEARWSQVGATREAVQTSADNCAVSARENAINNAGPIDVDQIIRDPDAVIGQFFQVTALVTQFDSATGPCTFRGVYDNQAYEYSFEYAGDNGVFTVTTGGCPQLDGIDNDDTIRLWVEGAGSLTYETQIGGSATVPAFEVLRAEIIAKG